MWALLWHIYSFSHKSHLRSFILPLQSFYIVLYLSDNFGQLYILLPSLSTAFLGLVVVSFVPIKGLTSIPIHSAFPVPFTISVITRHNRRMCVGCSLICFYKIFAMLALDICFLRLVNRPVVHYVSPTISLTRSSIVSGVN